MTAPPELVRVLHDYGAGLRAEVVLLTELRQLAAAERTAARSGDLDEVRRLVDARERVLGSILDLEKSVRPLRSILAHHAREARTLPGFAQVSALHRDADALVAAIAGEDDATLAALRQAESARRHTVQTLDAGEATLAAYRRVVAPAHGPSAIIDEQG